MKKQIIYYLILVILPLVGCGQRDSRLDSFQVPIWKESDLDWHTQNVTVYQVFSERKPPFHSGGTFSYEIGKTPGGVLFFYQFDDFQNQFVEPISIIKGARTISRRDGKLLAEARVNYFVDGNRQGREIEEYHYDADGILIFHCTSIIDPDTGFKIKEKEEMGTKKRDYYFVWPVR